jgi:hypothetical protein
MIETKDLLLDKGRIADWKVMFGNTKGLPDIRCGQPRRQKKQDMK